MSDDVLVVAPYNAQVAALPHRFNVATSRARGAVIVVANPKLFEPECRTPEQMRWVNGMCRYRELAVRKVVPAREMARQSTHAYRESAAFAVATGSARRL